MIQLKGGVEMANTISIQHALYDLWFRYYAEELTGEQRSSLVQSFIDEHTEGYDITSYTAKHPAHFHRESDIKYKQYKVIDILTDFIIRGEDDHTGLTQGAQTAANRKNKRKKHEELADFSEDSDEDIDGTVTPVSIEHDLYRDNPELYDDFTEEKEPELTVDEFTAMILDVKENAKYYADIYSAKYRKNYKDTLRRIRRLDVDRVDICEECGGVYYKHDLRSRYCDLQGDDKSTCKINAKRRIELDRYYEDNYRKFVQKGEDRAKIVHYLVGPNVEPCLLYHFN